MTNYEKAIAALRDLRRDAEGHELAELHFATGHLIKAQALASARVTAKSGTGLPPTPPEGP